MTRNKTGTKLVFVHAREVRMLRAVVEEAVALASLALFVGIVTIWVQIIAAL